jgi:tRNA(Ile)-lysidine synthase
VARVLERVTATARAHRMFDPGDTVLVAVSGGPDSLTLLHTLVRLRRLLRIRGVVALHFDHRLRTGSEREAARVGRQAGRLGVAFVARAARTSMPTGGSVEAWARRERYAAIAEVREEIGARVAAVGHTADDQAETVLLALVRGGGLEALAGMRPVTAATGIVRPLLDVSRQQTEAFCRALRLRPLRDPMNEDAPYLRVALRRDGIPSLEAATGRGVRSSLVRVSDLLRDDADLLAAMASEAFDRVVTRNPDGVAIHAEGVEALPRSIGTRVVRRALLAAGVLPEAAHVDAILALIARPRGRRLNLPGRVVVRRESEYVRLSFGPGTERSG